MPGQSKQKSVWVEKPRTTLTHSEAVENLKFYSTSPYESLRWDFSGYNTDRSYKTLDPVTFHVFKDFPVIQNQLKDWLVFQLNQRKNPNSLSNKLVPFRYLVRHNIITEDDLFKVNRNQILTYYTDLFGENSSFSNRNAHNLWSCFKSFYHDMNHLEIEAVLNKYYVDPRLNQNSSKEKYINRYVLDQLDEIFIKEEIPLVFRITYWLLRLYVNRISEVLSTPFNCLKKLDSYTCHLILPTFKETGPNASTLWREIALDRVGITGYLINLIEQQQKYLNDKGIKTDKLITGPVYRLIGDGFRPWGSKIGLYSADTFNYFLNNVIKAYDIRDKEGSLIHITSHCFRHTSITDRVDSGLFTLLDIASMSGHLSTSIIEKNYIHQDLNSIKDTLNELEENNVNIQSNVLGGSVEFIRRRAYSKELPGIGFCSDVRGCSNNPYECLLCEHFSPDEDIADKLKDEEKDWNKKLLIAVQTQNSEFEKQCRDNLDCIREFLNKQKGR